MVWTSTTQSKQTTAIFKMIFFSPIKIQTIITPPFVVWLKSVQQKTYENKFREIEHDRAVKTANTANG